MLFGMNLWGPVPDPSPHDLVTSFSLDRWTVAKKKPTFLSSATDA